ncbi:MULTISPECIES: hypothetical protein [unclassified Sphingomonas]|uniref:hypothetical protein n=1 Tax=unclassified Sphingomonas TaxID=196159 RepID=UPI002151F467|nr:MULTISPECIES: hypothetical protein [unclassified Sphingomonas]MCR5870243.1 hypothetical protein [Sphingomonas sp. J344]UUX98068.1 hypothetical protein LRS08_10560 [Sphingomonas sp. J315]
MKTLLLAVALSALPLAPASFAQDAAAPAATAATAAKFNLDTPIQDIVANPAAKAAFDAALPGVSTHESYEMFKGMSLNQLKAYAADKLTPEVLAKVEKDLAAVE